MFISRHTLKWTKTCRSSGDFPHAHTAHFLLNRHKRCEQWARRIGPGRAAVIGRLFAMERLDEQGVEPALAILRLSKRYSAQRLENACSPSLRSIASPAVFAHQTDPRIRPGRHGRDHRRRR